MFSFDVAKLWPLRWLRQSVCFSTLLYLSNLHLSLRNALISFGKQQQGAKQCNSTWHRNQTSRDCGNQVFLECFSGIIVKLMCLCKSFQPTAERCTSTVTFVPFYTSDDHLCWSCYFTLILCFIYSINIFRCNVLHLSTTVHFMMFIVLLKKKKMRGLEIEFCRVKFSKMSFLNFILLSENLSCLCFLSLMVVSVDSECKRESLNSSTHSWVTDILRSISSKLSLSWKFHFLNWNMHFIWSC